ncbi:unnamed protein product, partial [Prorocentrum cordatum]
SGPRDASAPGPVGASPPRSAPFLAGSAGVAPAMARPPRADAAAASAEAMSGRCSGSSAPSRSPRWGSSEQGRRWRLLPVPGRLGAAVAWACLAARPRGAAAWAKEGHQRIARVASELIKGVKRQKV